MQDANTQATRTHARTPPPPPSPNTHTHARTHALAHLISPRYSPVFPSLAYSLIYGLGPNIQSTPDWSIISCASLGKGRPGVMYVMLLMVMRVPWTSMYA